MICNHFETILKINLSKMKPGEISYSYSFLAQNRVNDSN